MKLNETPPYGVAVIFPKSVLDGTPVMEIAPRSPTIRERPGQLTGEFLLLYAGVRAIGEVFREPDASLLFGLSRGTFYSLFLVAGGLILFAMNCREPRNSTRDFGN
jgi:prolipoprotein diacylglyceryltransferase